MAKASGTTSHSSVKKHTSQGGSKPKTSSMNKTHRRNFKKYRGQGR